ncbi:MAG TPA: hypothetical protein PLR84_04385 [Chitinophagales bacterium]|nr:hypothetical protein [Chitinophagales bacterium]
MVFTSVKYVNEFPNGNNSPAAVNRKTGELFINKKRWSNIKAEHRVFILLHELAHCILDTSDEMAVDALAHTWYLQLGYSLSESVFALTKVLHADSDMNKKRSWAQYTRAKEIDNRNDVLNSYDGYAEICSNPCNLITDISNFDDNSILVQYDQYDFDINAELANVKGLSRKEYRKKKRAARLYKRLGRGKKKHAIANDIQAGADTRKTYADKGMYVPTRAESIAKGVGGTIQGIASAIGGTMGKGAAQSSYTEQEPTEQEQNYSNTNTARKKQTATAISEPVNNSTTSSNSKKIIIIGGFALMVLGIVVFSIKK